MCRHSSTTDRWKVGEPVVAHGDVEKRFARPARIGLQPFDEFAEPNVVAHRSFGFGRQVGTRRGRRLMAERQAIHGRALPSKPIQPSSLGKSV